MRVTYAGNFAGYLYAVFCVSNWNGYCYEMENYIQISIGRHVVISQFTEYESETKVAYFRPFWHTKTELLH
jgi:hypothetical protein